MADEQGSVIGRDQIAENVIKWSGAGILFTTVIVLAASFAVSKDLKDFKDVATTVFNTLIPLFGTWVGTVLAFYFSSKNYDAAAKTTRELVQQLGDERLKQISVKDAWIPVAAIEAVTVAAGQESTKPFAEIRAKLSNRVTRVPIWNADKVVRFVIHDSVIFKFLAVRAETQTEAVRRAAQANEDPPAAAADTLQTFLDFESDGAKMRTIVSKIAWVAQTATLADAKAKMESIPDCQDVFVTDGGKNNEPVLGWITNSDIAKKAKA